MRRQPPGPNQQPSFPARGLRCPNCGKYRTMRTGFWQFVHQTHGCLWVLIGPIMLIFGVIAALTSQGKVVYICEDCHYTWRLR